MPHDGDTNVYVGSDKRSGMTRKGWVGPNRLNAKEEKKEKSVFDKLYDSLY